MDYTSVVVPESLYRVLIELTRESRLEVAISLAVEELLHLRLEETRQRRSAFEKRHGTTFDDFRQAWDEDRLPDKHSHDVEKD